MDEKMKYQTSCSDNDEYTNFCKLAVADEVVFQHFRSHPHYTKVVETVPYEAGKSYLRLALQKNPEFIKYL